LDSEAIDGVPLSVLNGEASAYAQCSERCFPVIDQHVEVCGIGPSGLHPILDWEARISFARPLDRQSFAAVPYVQSSESGGLPDMADIHCAYCSAEQALTATKVVVIRYSLTVEW
jgi:hypothetical protein